MGHLCATKDYSFENMKRAVIIGSTMASFCVEKFGTARMNGLETKAINERVKQLEDLVRFKPFKP